jgi:Zn-dependent peptidase ImmA (M78 family)/DNA-binding XRE family transcriptional regulator
MDTHALDTIDPNLLGERIAESRRARRLTQQQVADALHLSRATVVATEKGGRRPKARELVALARLFGRPVADFIAERPLSGEPSFVVHFKSTLKSLPAGEAESLGPTIEQFERFCRWYIELEEALGSPLPRRWPEPYDIAGTPVDRAAEEVAISERNRLGLGDGPVSNVADLLEADVGLRIAPIEMGGVTVAAMYIATERYGACIAVNASHPEDRRRVDIAHVYAHFLTDRQRPEICLTDRPGRAAREERFAEAFAGAFLMPASGVQRRFDAIRRAKRDKPIIPADVLMLASLYRVPLAAMARRLEDLKLLPSGASIRLEQPGGSGELSASQRPRFTTRYTTLAVQAFAEGLLTEGQLAERLGTDRLGARLIVEDMTSGYRAGRDGDAERVSLDLSADLLGAD